MSGTKRYERDDLLDQAVELFRRYGYNGTSTATLVAELGINRKSMYAEFGSKQGLFESALERYNEKQLSAVLAPLEKPDADIETIREAFTSYAKARSGWFSGRGCLLTNTAVERAALDPGSAQHVNAYFSRLARAFRNALAKSQAAGELDASADLDALSAFFTTALVGVAACIRAEAPREQIDASCRVALDVLDRHEKTDGSRP